MPNDYTPYPFQVEGVEWIKSERRDESGRFIAQPLIGMFADEMGLGKSAEFLLSVKEKVKAGKRILLLVPGATITQWQKNWDRWINDNEPDEWGMDALYAIRSSDADIPKTHSCVMSHTLLARKPIVEKLAAANFDGIGIDEIHKFGADSSKRLTHLHALINLTPKDLEIKIGLSGTPVRNYAKEIYNICNFLAPEIPEFRNAENFARAYLTWDRKALAFPHKFHSQFAPFYLRRTVEQVQKDLPSIRRTKLYTDITNPFIRSAYNNQVDLMSNFVKNSEKVEAFSLLGYLAKLRHLTGVAKAQEPAIIEPIRDYLNEQGSVVIGLHHHFVNSRLKKSLGEFPFTDIRGGMNDREKERAKLDFIENAKAARRNGTINPICYLSIKAAAEGIDGLQFASRKAYVFERQWNGADELQFEKRLHRTGQTQSVDIEYTIAAGTVDEFFDEMVEMKRKITTQVEDQNYESNPAFLRELAQRVMNNRLPQPSAKELRDFEKELTVLDEEIA